MKNPILNFARAPAPETPSPLFADALRGLRQLQLPPKPAALADAEKTLAEAVAAQRRAREEQEAGRQKLIEDGVNMSAAFRALVAATEEADRAAVVAREAVRENMRPWRAECYALLDAKNALAQMLLTGPLDQLAAVAAVLAELRTESISRADTMPPLLFQLEPTLSQHLQRLAQIMTAVRDNSPVRV